MNSKLNLSPHTISLQIVMYFGRPVSELLEIKQLSHFAKSLLNLHLHVFKEYVCEYKHLFHRNGQSMEDCCYDLPGTVYGNGRSQTCPRGKSMQEDKNAGKKVKGTGKKGEGIGKYVLGKLQTLVYFKRP